MWRGKYPSWKYIHFFKVFSIPSRMLWSTDRIMFLFTIWINSHNSYSIIYRLFQFSLNQGLKAAKAAWKNKLFITWNLDLYPQETPGLISLNFMWKLRTDSRDLWKLFNLAYLPPFNLCTWCPAITFRDLRAVPFLLAVRDKRMYFAHSLRLIALKYCILTSAKTSLQM